LAGLDAQGGYQDSLEWFAGGAGEAGELEEDAPDSAAAESKSVELAGTTITLSR
jgi:hypothetical protein